MADFEYSATKLFEDVSDTDSALLRIQTGSKPIKVLIPFSSDGQTDLKIETGTTFTDGGTEVSIYKRNEKNDLSPTMEVYHTPVVDSSGTSIAEEFLPGGGKGINKIGGKSRGDSLIWKENTEHLLDAKNTSGSDSDIFLKVLMTEL